ncbi:MAG: M15 family metallopeptidase [Acetanaerobacterium sp.]
MVIIMRHLTLTAIAAATVMLLTACSYGMEGNTSSDIPKGSDAQLQNSSQIQQPADAESSAPSQDVQSGQEPDEQSGEGLDMTADKDDWRLILVNRQNPLPKGFTVDLVDTVKTESFTYRFDARASDALRDFMDAAKEDGVKLAVISTFRKQSTQENLYANKVAEYVNQGYSEEDAKNEAARWVAIPGTSEHQSGLAFDAVSSDWYSTNNDLYETFEETQEFEWLISHCVEYGFVLRYAKDKQDITGISYEPWHYRYVGEENARYMTEHNLCLEEFVEKLQG